MNAYVYRAYDADDRLLYVGSTTDISGRLLTHKEKAWWAPQVARIEAIAFPSIAEARDAERAQIASDNPRWNLKGRWRTRATWTAQDFRDYHLALVMAGNADTAHNAHHLHKVAVACRARFGIDLQSVPA